MKIFVACPIGAKDSPERRNSDKVLRHIISPVVAEVVGSNGPDVIVRSDLISEPGKISLQILREINECDVMVADLAGFNPNVMYEVGLRQGLRKPFILMAPMGLKLPFDLADLRTVFYQLELDAVEEAQAEFKAQLAKAIEGASSSLDNAVFGPAPTEEGKSASESSFPALGIEVLETCSKTLSEVNDIRSLLLDIGGLVVSLSKKEERDLELKKELQNQQLGMALMDKLIEKPEAADNIMSAMKFFADIGGNPKMINLKNKTPGKPTGR